MRKFTLALILPLALVAQAPMKPAPDFSKSPRSAVPPEHTWKVEDLFATEAAWRKELKAVQLEADKVEALAKGWTKTPKAMADLLVHTSEVERRLELAVCTAAACLTDATPSAGLRPVTECLELGRRYPARRL